MVTSLVGMHVFAILRNVLVKFEHVNATDYSKYFSGRKRKQPKKKLKHKETNLIT
jgi:hypothetical protein